MLIIAAYPVLTYANTNIVIKALKKIDFLVVIDIFMTPSLVFQEMAIFLGVMAYY